MTLFWHGAARAEEVVNLGPLALIHPLLDQLDIASIIDRHLPPDPQLEFSHGQVLSLLLAARLCQPTALINIPAWAQRTGADILWNLSADKLNDDRFGRALDAFFEHRHSIFASATAKALQLTNLSLQRLHFDTTHVTFWGAYETSQRRPGAPLSTLRGDALLPPAHIGHGYVSANLMIQVGLTAVVDSLGGLPVFSQCLDGQRNGRRAIAEQFQLLQQHLPLPTGLLMISDRGTYSADHISRLHRHGYDALCSMRWDDYQAVYDAHAELLHWQQASFLSIEQHRRRQTNSSLPREHYRLAVVKHNLIDANPVKETEPPKKAHREAQWWTAEEARSFLAHPAVAGHRLHALFRLALDAGLRQGELFALVWPDIHWDSATIHVQRSLEEVDGEYAIKQTKTRKGNRKIIVAAATLAALRRHREAMGEEKRDVKSGTVFLNTDGGWLGKSDFYKTFNRLVARAEMKKIRPYDLRHSCASMLLGAGASIRAIADRLGHEKISVTLDHYANCLPSDQGALVDLSGTLLDSPIIVPQS